jgi:putative endonuclease
MSKPWFVYMIETESKILYTGITVDVEKRFKTHVEGKGAKFFRIHRPKRIVYIDQVEGKESALQREIQIKKMSAQEKRQLIEKT